MVVDVLYSSYFAFCTVFLHAILESGSILQQIESSVIVGNTLRQIASSASVQFIYVITFLRSTNISHLAPEITHSVAKAITNKGN
jgi:hypothetical protein